MAYKNKQITDRLNVLLTRRLSTRNQVTRKYLVTTLTKELLSEADLLNSPYGAEDSATLSSINGCVDRILTECTDSGLLVRAGRGVYAKNKKYYGKKRK